MPNPYLPLLRLPGAAAFCAAALLGRLPMSMVGLGTVLLVQATTGSYGRAGLVAGALGLSQAVSAPVLGRLTDRHGQRAVLLPCVLLHAGGLGALIVLATARAPTVALAAGAAVAGGATPQLSSYVRARWAVLAPPERFGAALALESVLDEVVFVVGPPLVILLAVSIAPAAGLGVAVAAVCAGSMWLASQRGTAPGPAPPGSPALASALRTPALPVLLAVFAGQGVMFGAVEVSMVAFAGEAGQRSVAGPLLAVWAAASLVSGLLYGARRWQAPLPRRLLVALGVLAVGLAAVPLVRSPLVMALLLLVSGVATSPVLIAGFGIIQREVPPGALTEGMTWVTTAIGVGVAAGSATGGRLVDAGGSRLGFTLAVAGAVAAAAAGAAGQRRLAARASVLPGALPGALPASGVPGGVSP